MSSESEIVSVDPIDERLKQALEASNYRLTTNIQRENAKLKLKTRLVYSEAGGIFKISPEFISFVHTLAQHRKSSVLLDTNNNPIKIDSLEDFLENILEIYQESMNDYLLDFEKFKKLRTTTKVVDW